KSAVWRNRDGRSTGMRGRATCPPGDLIPAGQPQAMGDRSLTTSPSAGGNGSSPRTSVLAQPRIRADEVARPTAFSLLAGVEAQADEQVSAATYFLRACLVDIGA